MKQPCLDPPAFGHDGRERQSRDGHDGHERLQQQQRFVLRPLRERTVALEGPPDGEARQEENRGRRLARPEAERRPQQQRHGRELQRVMFDVRRVQTAEHQLAADHEREEQGRRLERLGPVPPHAGTSAPQQHDRRDHQIPRHIAEPPREPDRAVIRPVGVPTDRQRGHAHRRAHRRAEHCGDERELEDVGRALEGVAPAGKAVDQVRANHALKRVADAEPDRGGEGTCGREVDEESTGEDRRPRAQPEDQERGDGDSRGGPHRRRADVDERQAEAELAGDEVDRGEHREDGDVAPPRAAAGGHAPARDGQRVAHRYASRHGVPE